MHPPTVPGDPPSQPAAPTKYLINGRNCDTISNEPFIEPHLDNPEIGSQAAVGGGLVPNQRIPARQRSCITHTLPPAATSTHLSFVKRAKLYESCPQTSWKQRHPSSPSDRSTLECSLLLCKALSHPATNLQRLQGHLR